MTVITPAYNAEHFLEETIRSVQGQTFLEWEMIVVDDGSVDETLRLAEEAAHADSRIRVFAQDNRGQSASQNRALDEAQGEFIVLLDADDLMAADALERLLGRIAGAGSAVASYGDFLYLSEDGAQVIAPSLGGDRVRPEGDVVEELLVSNFLVACGSVIFRRDVALAVRGLREDLVIGQDWEFWLRLALHGDFVALGGPPVFFYRIREGSVSRFGGKHPRKYEALRERLFSNPDVVQRVAPKRLARLRRRFEATTYASSGRDALVNRRWGDALRYYLASGIRRPAKLSSWLLFAVALVRWAPPPLAKRLGIKS